MSSFDSAFSSGDAIKFANVGDAATFTITDVTEEERTNLNTGDPENVIVIHGTDDTGEGVRLFCQKKQLLYAIGVAVKEATGESGAPKAGGKLHVKRGPDGTPSKPGYSAPHSFECRYQAPTPTATASVAAAFDAEEVPF